MYFFYVDESGERNPEVKKEEPFVMIAIGLHEYQWRRFEATLNGRKRTLIQSIFDRTGIQLDLADAEVHSVDIRIPKRRAAHPFLKHLTEEELKGLIELYYGQLGSRHFTIIAVVVDKTCLLDYMDTEKVTRKVYELILVPKQKNVLVFCIACFSASTEVDAFKRKTPQGFPDKPAVRFIGWLEDQTQDYFLGMALERGESFIRNEHPKQQAVFVLDNTSKEMNRSIAMKHAYFQQSQTSSGIRLRHVVEMPFFVESYLSNGVQLADLCAYNVHRVFRSRNEKYLHFQKMLPWFYKSMLTAPEKIDGLKVFPDNHRWKDLLESIHKERARILSQVAGPSQ